MLSRIAFLRGLAILAVIAVHVSTNYLKILPQNLDSSKQLLTFVNVFLQVILRYGVPLFLIISGYVLTQKYTESFSARRFYRKRALHLAGPYLIFSFFYVMIDGLLKGWPSADRLLFAIITAGTTPHLWFFRLIVELYVLYPLLMKVYLHFETRRKEWVLLASVLLIQIFVTYAAAIYSAKFNNYFLEVPQFWFYFIFGIYLSRNPRVLAWIENFRGRRLFYLTFGLLAVSLVLSFFTFASYMARHDLALVKQAAILTFSFCQPFIAISWVFIAFALCDFYERNKHISIWIARLGQYSFGIYLIHPFFMGILARVFQFFYNDRLDGVFYPLMFFVTVVLSFGSVWLIHRTPVSEVAIGIKKCEARQQLLTPALRGDRSKASS